MDVNSLPYRKNVAIIAFKDDKFLLVNKHEFEEDWWKFPQGGLDENENLEVGARREFLEEVCSDKIKIIGISKFSHKYDWHNMELVQRKQARGQEQYFVIAKFVGKFSDVKPDGKEIRKIDWVNLETIQRYCDENKDLFGMYNGLIPKILKEFNFI